MPRFRKIYINSSHRKSGSSTKFHYELPVDQECTEVCHCAITSVSLPNVFFGIQTNVNNLLYIYERDGSNESNSQNRVLTLTAGNYSATTLNAAISMISSSLRCKVDVDILTNDCPRCNRMYSTDKLAGCSDGISLFRITLGA